MANRDEIPLTLRDPFFSDPFFRTVWHDFDDLQRQVIDESRTHWDRVEQQQRLQDHSKEKKAKTDEGVVAKSSDGDASTPGWFFPRRGLLPGLFHDRHLERMNLFQHQDDEHVIRMINNDQKFEVSLDTHGFKPDELKVKIDGRLVSVEGKHESKGENKYVSKTFRRMYTLPEECNIEQVHSNLSSDGILMVTAPKTAALEANRNIPIEMTK